MDIEIVYPKPELRTQAREEIKKIMLWCFLTAAYICPIVNICIGGKLWSIVVIWSMWVVWCTLLNPPLVENNLMSRTAHFLLNCAILLVLIDVCLSSGWAGFVVPIVCFALLVVLGILFFIDISQQRQNIMPMLWIIGGSLVALVIAIAGLLKMNWPTIALGSTAFALLVITIITLRRQFFAELKKRFHI
ncbi:MAG: hypothetical protein GXY26_04280 [Clostridiales bacterium]|jgi:hypothetical protein|nr:hypothetical protein [Clostridiales bacterium]